MQPHEENDIIVVVIGGGSGGGVVSQLPVGFPACPLKCSGWQNQ